MQREQKEAQKTQNRRESRSSPGGEAELGRRRGQLITIFEKVEKDGGEPGIEGGKERRKGLIKRTGGSPRREQEEGRRGL